MAEDRPPDSIVVSTNRSLDVAPYSTLIYNQRPDIWRDIFPWEFPQNATREEEEKFLRFWFSEYEIYMQGGATRDGAGFKFLKSVWYWIALWNLNCRVPHFTDWWLAKPSSIELLNDPNMQPFLFRDDVKPSTFFPDELPVYGEKFLSVVIPHLQKTAKDLLEKRQEEDKSSLTGENSTPPTEDIPSASSNVDQKSADVSYRADTPLTHVSSTHPPTSHPTAIKGAATAVPISPQSPQSPLLPPVPPNSTRSDHIDNQHDFQQNGQPQGRKRGNSGSRGNKVFNNRKPSLRERGAQDLPPSVYGQPQVPMNAPMRVPSSTPFDAMLAHRTQHMPSHFEQPVGAMQQLSSPENMHYGPVHAPFNNLFRDVSNQRQPYRVFSGEQQPSFYSQDGQHFHGGQPFHDGHLRNNQGPRGGRYRGNATMRGKGGRGRDSFSSAEPSRFNMVPENFHPALWGDPFDIQNQPKPRRGTVFREDNWRSSSDDPQARPKQFAMDENTMPPRPPLDQAYQQPLFQPQHMPVYATRQPTKEQIERVKVNETLSRHTRAPQSSYRDPYLLNLPDPNTLTKESMCGQDWIGKNCTYANKLVVFDVPRSKSCDEIGQFFRQFGTVVNVTTPHMQTSGIRDTNLVFITFETVGDARRCLLEKPETWLNGRLLRVEVSKQFWDPYHTKYIFVEKNAYADPMSPFEKLSGGSVWGSSIPDRSEEATPTLKSKAKGASATEFGSSETTPTPSNAGTPRKSKKKGNKKKKDQEDLRKASVSSRLPRSLPSQGVEDRSDTGSVVTTINHGASSTHIASTSSNATDHTTFAHKAGQQQRSDSIQTEHQTSSEPAFSPTVTLDPRFSSTITKDAQRSDSIQTEVQTTSEPPVSPVDDVAKVQIQNDVSPSQPFREDQKAQETTKIASEEDAGLKGDVVKEVETPVKSENGPVDDSFHTASSSPGTVKDASEGAVENSISSNVDVATAESTTSANKDAAVTSDQTISKTDSTTLDEESTQATADEGHVEVTVASPASASPVQKGSKADIAQLPAISTNTGKAPDILAVPQSAVSAGSSALPTPAFFTAPNTPAILQESPKEEKTKWASREQEKKSEKSKGPAQTESLSLFGKKKEKEKKPRGGKKGSMKGKPHAGDPGASSELDNGSKSRTPSVTMTSEPTKTDSNTKDQATQPTAAKASKDSKKKKQSKTSQDTERAMAEDLVAPSAPALPQEQTAPSKHKGLSGLLSGIFGGGQPTISLSKTVTGAAPSSKKLTDAKDREAAPEIVASSRKRNADAAACGGESASTTEGLKLRPTLPPLKSVLQTVDESSPTFSGHGLGISNTDTPIAGPDGAEEVKKKPKKKKRAGGKKAAEDVEASNATGTLDLELSSPAARSTPLSQVYHFGETRRTPDNASDVSSNTLGREDTPTSDLQSPSVSTFGKNLPPKVTGQSHLVEAKSPMWKQKKRVINVRAQEAQPDLEEESDDDEGSVMFVQESPDGSDKRTSRREIRSTRSDKVYLYVGPGRRCEMTEEQERGLTLDNDEEREQLQRLAREEWARQQQFDPSDSSSVAVSPRQRGSATTRVEECRD